MKSEVSLNPNKEMYRALGEPDFIIPMLKRAQRHNDFMSLNLKTDANHNITITHYEVHDLPKFF